MTLRASLPTWTAAAVLLTTALAGCLGGDRVDVFGLDLHLDAVVLEGGNGTRSRVCGASSSYNATGDTLELGDPGIGPGGNRTDLIVLIRSNISTPFMPHCLDSGWAFLAPGSGFEANLSDTVEKLSLTVERTSDGDLLLQNRSVEPDGAEANVTSTVTYDEYGSGWRLRYTLKATLEPAGSIPADDINRRP